LLRLLACHPGSAQASTKDCGSRHGIAMQASARERVGTSRPCAPLRLHIYSAFR